MELDKKIKVKKIFDVFSDVEEVKKYYGKEVYCADFIENFSNLKLYTNKFVLKNVFPEECKPFLVGGQQYRFILPVCQQNLWNRKNSIEHIPYLNFTQSSI